MRKHLGMMISITFLGLGAGCAAEGEDEAELETIASSDSYCVVEWLGFQRSRRGLSYSQCDHMAGEIGHQHCEEVRDGAPGEFRLDLLIAFYDPQTGYENWDTKRYYCER